MRTNLRTLISAGCFTLVSLLSFSIWAWGGRLFSSEPILYTACAVVFLLLGGIALLPATGLSSVRQATAFCLKFAMGFVVFAFLWSAAWFFFRDTFGEVVGSFAGILTMTLILRFRSAARAPLFISVSIIFLWYTVGYYSGEFAYQSLQGKGRFPLAWHGAPADITLIARLAWGACFGLGMGTGLAHFLQISRHT